MHVRPRLALVTVLVVGGAVAAGYFLWPSGHHVAVCPGVTVAPLPAGAQKTLEAYDRTRLRYDVQSSSDGDRNDTWFDPITGASRTLTFDSQGRFTSEDGSSWAGKKLRAVFISFGDRTWRSTTISTPHGYTSGDDGAVAASLGVRRALANGTATNAGQAVVGGRKTLHVHESRLDLWVDPVTYLPVHTRIGQAGHGFVSEKLTWLVRDASNNLSTRVIVPPGFKQVELPGESTSVMETTTACAQS